MGVLTVVTNCAKATLAGVSLICTFYSVIDLMVFLSHPSYNGKNAVGNDESTWTWNLFVDVVLLDLFIFAHSFMAHEKIKGLFTKYKLNDIQRSIYIIITCVTLQIMTNNWCPTYDFYLWNLPSSNKILHWVFTLMHVFAWLITYIGCICMDVNELLGLKQIYYSIQRLPDPLACKSRELQRLYTHMRHPSFLAFTVICWCVPTMTIDRLLLSVIMTAYMFIGWKTDDADYHYQRMQFSRKFATS